MLALADCISDDGKYADGTNQVDLQLLWNFIQICKDYGEYRGEKSTTYLEKSTTNLPTSM